MKIIKKIGLVLLVIIALLVLVSFFLPSKVHVERSLTIKAPPELIFSEVNNLKNWAHWSPWLRLDPAMKMSYEGPEEGVGAKYSWQSEHPKVGDGSMWIIESKPAELVLTQMDMGDMGRPKGTYKLEKNGDETKVTWIMDADGEGIPWSMYVPSKFFNLFMDDMLGPMFEAGLKNMDSVATALLNEQGASPQAGGNYEVKEVNVVSKPILSIREKCQSKQIGEKLAELYGEMMKYAEASGMKISEPPYAVYHSFDPSPEGTTDLEAAVVFDKPGKSQGRIKAGVRMECKALRCSFYGPYEMTAQAHEAIQAYAQEKNIRFAGPPWEVYVTDPTNEKDSNKWLSEVYYPIP